MIFFGKMGIQYSLLSNIVKAQVIIAVHLLFLSTSVQAQNSGRKPQFWNNVGAGYIMSDKLYLENELSYNVLIDKDFPWSEIANTTSATFLVKPFMLMSTGVYLASTKQSKTLSSFEFRPYVGVRFLTKANARVVISNLSRVGMRNLSYSDDTQSSTYRFRNRTTGVLAINRNSILADNTFSIFAYFEAFHNFEKDVVERYFTTLKYKVGFSYRFSSQWRVNAGTLFNQARSTIVAPIQLPEEITTNFIVEWGVTYVFLNR